jgi:hypothetical protein
MKVEEFQRTIGDSAEIEDMAKEQVITASKVHTASKTVVKEPIVD